VQRRGRRSGMPRKPQGRPEAGGPRRLCLRCT
jgi:hypothetical protein